ncbi:MAG: zf-HC2 domain-containing protein [Clostridia bacterium]|nr:zf-HC2 domain-containing protein [Clostridia bacterium]
MNCEIIKDLLPLYADEACSDESAKAVEEHISHCNSCRAELESMGAKLPEKTDEAAIRTITEKTRGRIGLLKASVLQTVCMLMAFLIITWGVYKEAYIPTGLTNGSMAFWTVAPATGFLLSLLNWHFVRFYESRRNFVCATAALCAILTVCLWLWCIHHYELFPAYADSLARLFRLYIQRGLVTTAVLTAASAVMSSIYAKLTGKE